MMRNPSIPRAFTLVELIATMTIISVASAVTATVISSSARSYADASRTSSLHAAASSALDRIALELKACPLDPAAPTPSPHITRVRRASIDWANGYRLQRNTRARTLTLTTPSQPAVILASNVSAFTIRTYDHRNALLPANLNAITARNIRRIEITITLTSGRSTDTIRTRITPRALAVAQP